MSEHALRRILVAVAIIVAAYAVVTVVRGDGSEAVDEGAAELSELLASLDAESVDAVAFENDGGTIRLERTDGAWTVDGFRADSATVARFWNQIGEARVEGPVARNPDNHGRLGVTEEAAAHVSFEGVEGSTRTLLVGESGPAGRSAYVRTPVDDAVFLFHGDLRGAARRALDAWRDRTIARVDTSRVRAVALDRAEGTETLRREDGSWRIGEADADSAAVRGVLGALSRLRASGFAPDGVSIDEVERRLVATGTGSDTLAVLELTSRDPSGFFVRSAGDPVVYEISSFEGRRLFPDELVAGKEEPAEGQ